MIVPLFLAALQSGPTGDLRRLFAAGPKDAYVMLAPETVCDSRAQETVWTADGSALVIDRFVVEGTRDDLAVATLGLPRSDRTETLRRRQEIVVWSVALHRAKTVVSVPGAAMIGGLEAMAGTDRVVFATSERIPGVNGAPDGEVAGVTLLAAGSGTLVRLDQTTDGLFDAVQLSPSRPIGFMYRPGGGSKAASVRYFGPNGTTGPWLVLPPRQRPDFNAEGQPVLAMVVTNDGDGKRHLRYQRVDPAAGGVGEWVEATLRPTANEVHDEPALSVSATFSSAPPVVPSVLLRAREGKPEEAGVVTTDGTEPLLSPKLDAVAYVSQGGVRVRSIVRVDRAAYDAAVLAAKKALAINNAKQAALGLMMYSADYDDNFPSYGDYDKIEPYLKDRSIMDSFTYTFGGGSTTDIESPATTEIGYVTGPGGRAVAYADGHVRWIPDAP